MEVVEALNDLSEDDGDVDLLEAARLHQVQGRAAAQVLHDDPQLGALPAEVRSRSDVSCSGGGGAAGGRVTSRQAKTGTGL